MNTRKLQRVMNPFSTIKTLFHFKETVSAFSLTCQNQVNETGISFSSKFMILHLQFTLASFLQTKWYPPFSRVNSLTCAPIICSATVLIAAGERSISSLLFVSLFGLPSHLSQTFQDFLFTRLFLILFHNFLLSNSFTSKRLEKNDQGKTQIYSSFK